MCFIALKSSVKRPLPLTALFPAASTSFQITLLLPAVQHKGLSLVISLALSQ